MKRYVAILDSWTGERVRVWNVSVDKNEFISSALECCEAVKGRMGVEENDSIIRNQKKPYDLDSDEMMSDLPSDFEEDEADDDDCVEIIEPTGFDGIIAVPHEEPKAGETIRIQFKLPGKLFESTINSDGTKIVRKVLKEDPVKKLYEFLKTKIDKKFEVTPKTI